MLKRSSKVLSLSENVKVLENNNNNKSYIEVGKIHTKNKFSIHEIMTEKKKKEIQASFAAEPQTAKIMDKCLVKMEKVLNLLMDNRNTKHISSDGRGLHQEALSLQEDHSQRLTETGDTSFTASKGRLHRFSNRFGLKNVKITGKLHLPMKKPLSHFWPS